MKFEYIVVQIDNHTRIPYIIIVDIDEKLLGVFPKHNLHGVSKVTTHVVIDDQLLGVFPKHNLHSESKVTTHAVIDDQLLGVFFLNITCMACLNLLLML